MTAANILPLSPPAEAAAPPAVREPGRPWPLGELATWLSVSPDTIRRLLKAGRLQRLEGFSRRVLISDASVRALAAGWAK